MRVTEVWRYPVTSAQGERVAGSTVLLDVTKRIDRCMMPERL